MASRRKADDKELLRDYFMMESMAKELKWHQDRIRAIGKRVVKKAAKTDLKDGIIENLDVVVTHMKNAQRELDRAMGKLKMI